MLRSPVRALFALAIFATCTSAASADTSSADSLIEIAHITTGDRHDEPLAKSARPTYIVDKAQIIAEGARTVAEALAQVPGISIFQYGGYSSLSSVSILGGSSLEALVLIDGILIRNASSGSNDLDSISTAGVSRIEVTEGGSSTLYGSSAVTGVINIITGAPDAPTATIWAGSFNESGLTAEGTAKVGRATLGLAGERRTMRDDFTYPDATTYGSTSGITAGRRLNNDAETWSGRAVFDERFSHDYSVHAFLDEESQHLGLPGQFGNNTYSQMNSITPASVLPYDPIARQISHRQDIAARLDRTRGKSTLSLTLSADQNTLAGSDYGVNLGAPPPTDSTQPIIAQNDTDDRRVNVSLSALTQVRSGRVLLGVDESRETASNNAGTGVAGINFGAAQAQSAAYVQLEHDLKNAGRLYAGLREEKDSPNGGALDPAFGGLLPLGNLRLRANFAEAFRVPTLIDLYYPGSSNSALVPEHTANGDIALEDPHVLGGVSVGAYGRHGRNFITYVADSHGVFSPLNIARASTQGLVITAKTKPFHRVVTTASYTDNYLANQTSTMPYTRFPYVPTFISKLAIEAPIEQQKPGYGLEAAVTGPSMQYGDPSQTFALVNVGTRTIIGAHIALPISPNATLTVRARNLGDDQTESIDGYPQPGAAIGAEVTIHE